MTLGSVRSGRWRRWLLAALALFLIGSAVYETNKPLPAGISYAGAPQPARSVSFLADLTFVDASGERRVDQRIFDEVFAMIRGARRFVVLDLFLFNAFQGDVREDTRALSSELADLLVEQKRLYPELEIALVTDPVNTVYGGLPSPTFRDLEDAGISVIVTDLDPLRDSNPAYSVVWRWFIRPFGTGGLGTLPNPFGAGRVSLRAYLRLLNFKANHRKVVVVDSPDGVSGLVTSANPHDGSSAHGNVAIRFDGAAVGDLLATERAVAAFSQGSVPRPELAQDAAGNATVRVLTEGKIGEAIDQVLERASSDDELAIAVFYLSDRRVVRELIEAHERGARVRVVLDPNRDAFGMEKNGVPNRPVAAELTRAGIPVRWCDTHGEQCHAKLLLARSGDQTTLIAGSANFTRRNLRDFNLETNVMVRGPQAEPVMRDAWSYFEQIWSNDSGRHMTVPYETHSDESRSKRWIYLLSEATGIGTH